MTAKTERQKERVRGRKTKCKKYSTGGNCLVKRGCSEEISCVGVFVHGCEVFAFCQNSFQSLLTQTPEVVALPFKGVVAISQIFLAIVAACQPALVCMNGELQLHLRLLQGGDNKLFIIMVRGGGESRKCYTELICICLC